MFNKEIDDPLIGDKTSCWKKHWKTILVLFAIIVAITITIVLVVVLTKEEKKEEEKKNSLPVEIIKNDSDFIKPPIKLNAEFKLVRTQNGMTGLLINDPYTDFSVVELNVPNGSYTETVPGLAHFAEHMIGGGCENFPDIVPMYNPIIGGVLNAKEEAYTEGNIQKYFTTVPFGFLFEETINLLIDSFRYPFYKAEVVKKEIQAVNSEFYLRTNLLEYLLISIIQQLSNNKTSFNGMQLGNNETLNPDESEILAKKLRGYHMEVNKPENIFFSLYSNATMNTLENYTKKYFTYKMHEFKDDEIDVEDRKKLIENAKNVFELDIFDENLYNHGFYLNSESKINELNIYFQLGKIDYKEIQFELKDYLTYLFRCKSLKNILIEKNYIAKMISVYSDIEIGNNNVFRLTITLTEEGTKNISDVLLIIYKYIEIIKAQGYQKKYFDNFIKYKRNKQLLDFNKDNFKDIDGTFLSKVIRNYRLYGVNQIFTDGTPSEKDYNEEKLKEILNKFQYEKSFFGVNVINKTESFLSNTFLESPTMKTLKYYNKQYLYGKIPEELKNKIKDKNYDINNLQIREISSLFSEKYEKVIPCYKSSPNKCKELNEFDLEREDNYNGTSILYGENPNINTVYQIDKSSESYLVNSYLQFHFLNEENNEKLTYYLVFNKLFEIDELEIFSVDVLDEKILTLKFKCFNDNIEKIYDKLFELLKDSPKENEINFTKNRMISDKTEELQKNSLDTYTSNLFREFMNGKKSTYDDLNEIIKEIEEEFIDFKNYYENEFLNSLEKISLTIAGNIDKNLVERLHNKTISNFNIKKTNKILLNQPQLKAVQNSYIINYYEKSKFLDIPDNSILVVYQYEQKYLGVMNVLSACMKMFAVPLLRFNYSNAYTPEITTANNRYLFIFERGKYKGIDGMEDDINQVIYDMLNGKYKVPNYLDIVKSFILQGNDKVDKTPDYLFDSFLEELYPNNFESLKEGELLSVPPTFEELIKLVAPIFTNPKRFTFLVVRPEVSDDDYKKLIEKRKASYKYNLNETVNIVHTEDIAYWVNNQ